MEIGFIMFFMVVIVDIGELRVGGVMEVCKMLKDMEEVDKVLVVVGVEVLGVEGVGMGVGEVIVVV